MPIYSHLPVILTVLNICSQGHGSLWGHDQLPVPSQPQEHGGARGDSQRIEIMNSIGFLFFLCVPLPLFYPGVHEASCRGAAGWHRDDSRSQQVAKTKIKSLMMMITMMMMMMIMMKMIMMIMTMMMTKMMTMIKTQLFHPQVLHRAEHLPPQVHKESPAAARGPGGGGGGG